MGMGCSVGGWGRVEGGVGKISEKFPGISPEIPEGSLFPMWKLIYIYCDTRTENVLTRHSRDEFHDHTGLTC